MLLLPATLINKRYSPKHEVFHACASILKPLTNWLQSLLVVYLIKLCLTSLKYKAMYGVLFQTEAYLSLNNGRLPVPPIFFLDNKNTCLVLISPHSLKLQKSILVLDVLKHHSQGCALRKISGSPSGSLAFQLGCPALQVGRPNSFNSLFN